MGNERTLMVTGASGRLGRRVVDLLAEARAGRVIAGTRHPERLTGLAARGVEARHADFDDPVSLDAAFRGVDRLLLVSTDALAPPGRRARQHLAAIAAAARAGVKHVVYTSLPHPEPGTPVAIAADHWATEQALAASGLGWTVLRDHLYMDLMLPSLAHAVASGTLVAAAGAHGAAYVTREDCARAAAAALASEDRASRVLDVTGPAVVTYAGIATVLGDLTGRRVTYVPLEPAAFRAGLLAAGVPPAVADVLVSFDLGKIAGRFAPASSVVKELTGRAPTSLADFLSARRAALGAPVQAS